MLFGLKKNTIAGLLAAFIYTVPVYADLLQTYDIEATTVNSATVSGSLTFDISTSVFISPSFVRVAGEVGIYNTYNASEWNGVYHIINDSAVNPSGNPLYVNLQYPNLQQNLELSNLYLQFVNTGGVLSLSNASEVGYTKLQDHFATMTLTAVPIASAIWLFVSAFVGFVGLNRRKPIQQ